VLTGQRLKLVDECSVVDESEIGLDPVFERPQARLLELGDLSWRGRLVGDIGKRTPPPEAKSLVQGGGVRRVTVS